MIVNGQRNKVVLTIANKEKADYSVLAVSGKVTLPEDPSKILRNVSLLPSKHTLYRVLIYSY